MNLIYAVEDEKNIRELYEYALSDAFNIKTFEKSEEFLDALNIIKPDIVLLDIMLDEKDGTELIKYMKNNKNFADIPVIMVSAKDDEFTKVKLLDLGADDYIAKPFGIFELSARIRANIRRFSAKTSKIGSISLDEMTRKASVMGEEISLTLKEYELLKYLIINFNKVVKRDELLDKIWGIDFVCESRTLDMHVKSLRAKLEKADCKIDTVRGVGFILKNAEGL